MAVRRCRKEDLRRIAKATGATLVSSLANLDGEETFEKEYLGYADEVVQERISDDELILVKGTKIVNSSSVILRGANGSSSLPFLPVERRVVAGDVESGCRS
jgi:T-complex protein 1 subunit alpha